MHITVFRNRKRSGLDQEAYDAETVRMRELASEQSGFLSFKNYTADDGEAIALSEWETEEDARAWGRHPEHAAAQGRGRQDYYESYTIYSCADPRITHFDRSKA